MPPVLIRLMVRPFLLVLAPVLALVLAAGSAHAHAVLQSTVPADGALVMQAPDVAHLTFNEGVRPLVIRLVAPDGTEADLTAEVPAGAALAVPLPGLGQGTHVLSWRVASDDGHPIAGALVFSVGRVTGAAEIAAGDDRLRVAIWLARALMTAGLVLGVGGVFLATVVARTAPGGAVRAAALVGAVAAPAYLGLHGLDALGLGFAGLLTPAPWVAALGTSFGPSVALCMVSAVLALAVRRRALLAWGALGVLAVAYAAAGHAGAADPRWLMRPLVLIHVAALVFWVGALIPLVLALRRGDGAATLRRFSGLIPGVVAVLLVSGVGLALVQLGRDPAAWWAPYGYILAAKLALLAAMFALAAVNRWRLTDPVLAGDPAATGRLTRAIRAELVLALVILGLTAGWRFTPPPRALAQVAPVTAPVAWGHLHSDTVMANLSVTPGTAGPVTIGIELLDGAMAPLDPMALTLGLAMPDRGIERLSRPALPVEGQPGIWTIPDLVLPLAGRWDIDLEIRLTRFNLTRLSGEIDIK